MIVLGREIKTGCQKCVKEAELEQIKFENNQKKSTRDRKIKELLNRSSIPIRFSSKNFENYIPCSIRGEKALNISIKYAKNFEERLSVGGGMIFCGMPGTGKTHLSCAIANHIIRENSYSALFASVLSMTRRVKETYSNGSEYTERHVLQVYSSPELLIIDEVGVQYGSDSEKLILFEIINTRYESMKPTILISNLTLIELTGFIGERLVDRMKEGNGIVVSFDWESYRSNK